MKKAILLHGVPDKDEYFNAKIPSASNDHWFPWLQNQLMTRGIKADTPEVFNAYKLKWEDWKGEVERFAPASASILVGHSCGGGFWMRYMSEHPELTFDTVVLVAPWLNVMHEEDTDFFDFEIDPNLIKRAKKFVIFTSDNDMEDVQNSIGYLKKVFPPEVFREFHNYGHFCYSDMKTEEFPELLETITS